MAYYIAPNTSALVSHTTPLIARLDTISVAPFLPSGHTIQWRLNGAAIAGKTGDTADTFYGSINTGAVGDFAFTASDTGAFIDFLIDPLDITPLTSQVLILSNNQPTLSGAGPLTDSYNRTTGRPTIVWTYADADSDPQFQYQVKIGSTAGGTDYYDTGIVTSGAATTFSVTVPTLTAAIPAGTTYYWTVEVSDGAKINPLDVSPTPARVLTTAAGTGTVNIAPVVSNILINGVNGGATISSKNPTISWTYTDPDLQPQVSYRIIVAQDIGLTQVYWDSGTIPSANTSAVYNFNLLGTELDSHQTIYVGVVVSDGTDLSTQVVDSFRISSAPIITTLTVDSKVNPLNIRSNLPFFNWLYIDEDDDSLVAYEIRISTSDADLGTDSFIGIIWHPGVIFTPESYGVRFNADGTAFPGCPAISQLVTGVRYYFQVQIHDAFDTSEWAVGYFQLNGAPTAANLAIVPAAPFNSDDLFARYDFIDDIGDVERNSQIRWFRNPTDGPPEEILSLRNKISVPHELTIPGDEWYFTVRPSDGIDFSVLTYQSAPVLILNRAPTASALAILPSQPRTADALEAVFAVSDPDEDSVKVSINWFKNGVEQPELRNTKVIPASITSVDEEWYFTVLPNDGYVNGPTATSATVKILNTPPSLLSVSVEGEVLPKAVKSVNPTISWVYHDDDGQGQEKYQVIIGTKPARTRRILTNIRALSPTSAGVGFALNCDGDDGVISTAKDGVLLAGDEIFDSGVVDSSDNFFEYVTEDFKRQVVLNTASFSNLTGYAVAPDLQTLTFQPNVPAATAAAQFPGDSAFYDVELTYIKEEGKRSTYKLIVDGTIIGQFTSQPGIGSATHTFNAVRIDNGSVVSINGLAVDSGAKGKFRQLFCTPVSQLTLNTGEFKTLSGYLLDGAGGIKLAGLAGTATTTFSFPSGTYDIELVYVTETNGNPVVSLSVNSSVVLSFNYESGVATRSRFVSGVDIDFGDTIKISGTRSAGAQARVKKVIFRPTTTVQAGAKLREGITYYSSVRVFDGREWSDWYTTKFTMEGSAWASVANATGWTIEARFKISELPAKETSLDDSVIIENAIDAALEEL